MLDRCTVLSSRAMGTIVMFEIRHFMAVAPLNMNLLTAIILTPIKSNLHTINSLLQEVMVDPILLLATTNHLSTVATALLVTTASLNLSMVALAATEGIPHHHHTTNLRRLQAAACTTTHPTEAMSMAAPPTSIHHRPTPATTTTDMEATEEVAMVTVATVVTDCILQEEAIMALTRFSIALTTTLVEAHHRSSVEELMEAVRRSMAEVKQEIMAEASVVATVVNTMAAMVAVHLMICCMMPKTTMRLLRRKSLKSMMTDLEAHSSTSILPMMIHMAAIIMVAMGATVAMAHTIETVQARTNPAYNLALAISLTPHIDVN